MGWKGALVVTALLFGPGAMALAPTAQAEPSSIPSFLSTLGVTAPGPARDTASFGLAVGTTPGFDPGADLPEPPPPPSSAWVEAYVVGAASGTASRLHRSLIPPSAEATWALRLDSAGPAGALSLRFDDAMAREVPTRFGLDLVADGVAYDLRELRAFELSKPAGPHTAWIEIRIAPLAGSPPAAPQNLTAAHGNLPGDVALTWEPPASDGGHPVLRYALHRTTQGNAAEFLAYVNGTRYTDTGREAGVTYVYEAAAVTRRGEGSPSSPTSHTGTGKPSALSPSPGNPDDEQTTVAAEAIEAPSQPVGLEPRSIPLLHVKGNQQREDPRYYDFEARGPDGQPRRGSIYTGQLVGSRIEARAADVPGASAETPAARAGAQVVMRHSADGHDRVIVGTSLDANGRTFRDESGAPLPLDP